MERTHINSAYVALLPSGTEVAEKALAAGKYLNVLLTCKGTKPKDVDTALPSGTDAVDVDAYEHTRRIETCYSAASRELVRLLWHDHDLMGHLYSLKRFFLMEQVREASCVCSCIACYSTILRHK